MIKRTKWSGADSQAFADGLRTRAQTYADKRKLSAKRACRKRRWEVNEL